MVKQFVVSGRPFHIFGLLMLTPARLHAVTTNEQEYASAIIDVEEEKVAEVTAKAKDYGLHLVSRIPDKDDREGKRRAEQRMEDYHGGFTA